MLEAVKARHWFSAMHDVTSLLIAATCSLSSLDDFRIFDDDTLVNVRIVDG